MSNPGNGDAEYSLGCYASDMRFAFLLGFATITAGAANLDSLLDLAGNPVDPFASSRRVRVFLFVRTDCPITNRYAPEVQRLYAEFSPRNAEFWLVYSDTRQSARDIVEHGKQYGFREKVLRDSRHLLARRAHATVAPEAAVFDGQGKLVYHGRIDDRYVDFGKSRAAPTRHDLEDAISAVLEGKPILEQATQAIGCSLADLE